MKLFIFLLIPQICLASWNPEVRKKIETLNQTYAHMKEGAATTYWGAIQRMLNFLPSKGRMETLPLKNHFKSGKIDFYFEELDKEGSLVIFTPGIFGSAVKDRMAKNTVKKISGHGKHILSIPNLMSDFYMQNQPQGMTDPIAFHVDVAFSVFKWVYSQIEKKQNGKITLVAESLGTYMALGLHDRIKQDPKYKNLKMKLMIFWPPVSLKESVLNIDKKMLEAPEEYENCNIKIQIPRIIYHWFFQKVPIGIPDSLSRCLSLHFMREVFMANGAKKYMAYAKKVGIQNPVKPKLLSEIVKAYDEGMYNAALSNDDRVRLEYWISKIDPKDLNMISSENDFINRPDQWTELKNKYQESLIYLKIGGHSGLLEFLPWDSLLETEFL